MTKSLPIGFATLYSMEENVWKNYRKEDHLRLIRSLWKSFALILSKGWRNFADGLIGGKIIKELDTINSDERNNTL